MFSIDNLQNYISLHFDYMKNHNCIIFFETNMKDRGKQINELRELRKERNNLLDTVEDKFSYYIKLKRKLLKI